MYKITAEDNPHCYIECPTPYGFAFYVHPYCKTGCEESKIVAGIMELIGDGSDGQQMDLSIEIDGRYCIQQPTTMFHAIRGLLDIVIEQESKGDVYMHDGQSAQSILTNQFKMYREKFAETIFTRSQDPEMINAFITLDIVDLKGGDNWSYESKFQQQTILEIIDSFLEESENLNPPPKRLAFG